MKFKNRKISRFQRENLRRKRNKRRQGKCSYCRARFIENTKYFNTSIISSTDEQQIEKRVVFLLGAGAVKIWKNGTTGADILKSILEYKGYMTKDKNITVGQKIFELLSTYYNKEEINFETIIAFIEEILNYSLNRDQKNVNPNDFSIIPIIYDLKVIINQIKDYKIIAPIEEFDEYGNQKFIFESPHSNSVRFNMPLSEISMENYYFHALLLKYFNKINILIRQYDNSEYGENDKNLLKLINNLKSKNKIIRFYTTNYDRKLPNLFHKRLKIFDGFTDEHSDDYEKGFPLNIKRIIEDSDCFNYYNLHGSVQWEDQLQMNPFGHHFFCYPNKFTDPNTNYRLEQTNPGQKILISNIITGYNKVQRLSIPPFNLFYQAFYKDIISADTIIIIGYSLNDPHINRVISTAFQLGEPKILLIDYFEEEDYFRLNKFKNNLDFNIIGTEKFKLRSLSTERLEKSEDSKQFLYKDGFGEFLKDESNWNVLF